ncbi:DNA polymerase delta, subunit 4-domain-containing protein [Lophiotrema nucula]|uniref:DNA polymerase delta, subunit 4-domain-containing protein n=1 Tax=Lophiotrema nucula TaxID=690887 RepID=A0A6A5ZR79_9PLEO|nr:DNA polymerase delta, subunit 4-domain-containing protein [Lophiotrema nucula]
MPPKRRASANAAKGQQSTLAFHGASNKVTKPGARTQNAKKNLLTSAAAKSSPVDVADISASDVEEPATAEAAIIEQTQQEINAQRLQSTPEEDKARKISEAKIEEYWEAKQKKRKAPRVHQENLSLHEKILREWDMSGQYGPCTGIARLKRWKRAQRLDLDPPIEVLAVLLKEQEKNDSVTVQRSHVDELLNSRAEAVV